MAAAATINKNIRGPKVPFGPKQRHTHTHTLADWQNDGLFYYTRKNDDEHVDDAVVGFFSHSKQIIHVSYFLQKLILQIHSKCENEYQNLGEVCIDS